MKVIKIFSGSKPIVILRVEAEGPIEVEVTEEAAAPRQAAPAGEVKVETVPAPVKAPEPEVVAPEVVPPKPPKAEAPVPQTAPAGEEQAGETAGEGEEVIPIKIEEERGEAPTVVREEEEHRRGADRKEEILDRLLSLAREPE